MSTPTKISPRNPVCRLCGDSHESRYMLRIFSKAGSTKDLYPKVYKTCGIIISEDDMRSKVLCQQGLCFIRKQDGTVCSESPIHREYAVGSKLRICCKAMCSAFTFASTVEAFIIEYAIYARGGAVKLKPITPTRKQLSFSTPQAVSVLMPRSAEDSCSTPSADQPKRNTSRSAEHSSFWTLRRTQA